ncbi:MAG: hypothetical protein ACLQGV_11335 [Bryobacteraceae bacterium]
MRARLFVVALVVAVCAVNASAANLFTLTGTTQFGFSDTAQVAAFSTTTLYTNVTIAMPLKDESSSGPIFGTEGTVYLTNAIGAGTTVGNQVAPPVTVTGLTTSFTPVTLWTGLTLPPGAYYVTVVSANPGPNLSLSASAASSGTQTITTGPGVSDVGSRVTSTVAAFPPASSFGGFNPPSQIYITATGTPSPTGNMFTLIGAYPFGFSDTAQVAAFQTTIPYSNVSISMPLTDETTGGPIHTTEGTVYLMNSIGAGTTNANEVAPPFTVSGLTANFTNVTLWSGLNLPAGTYCVVVVASVASPNLSLSAAAAASGAQIITTGAGVNDVGSRVTSALQPFPPASNFGGFNPPSQIFITVTGDPSAPSSTPLPPTGILTLAGLAAAGLYRRSQTKKA